ncbi:MAG: rod-binding protein [Pseudomonadota bacterium]
MQILPLAPPPNDRNKALMTQARALEAAFLTEMLGYAGVGTTPESFGGGIGEDQFASFLREEQARLMVAKGGIGLAETLFDAMVRVDNGA